MTTSVRSPAVDPDIRPIFADPTSADAAYMKDVAETKRFLERWSLDRAFREALEQDAVAAVARYGFDVDVEALRPIWDAATAKRLKAEAAAGLPVVLPATVRRYNAFIREKLEYRDRMRVAQEPRDPRMASWRLRQMHRCVGELGPQKSDGLVHATAAFELAKGCTVGCWFCAVGAEPFAEAARYTPEMAGLWRGCLEVVRDVIGESTRWGFCYWASDPMDNPDYERFCLDFAQILGRFPQTTTAIAMRDVARTRALLTLSAAHGCELNRFSILTRKILDQVHATFTAEELAYVELLPLNKESDVVKVNAGRARVRVPKGEKVVDPAYASTIACVSGFLFNMVERSVRLVTPCNASDRWPLGYWTLERGTFDSPASLRALLTGMIERNMKPVLGADDLVRFRRDVQWGQDEQGYHATSLWVRRRIGGYPAIGPLGELIVAGQHSAGDLALAMEAEHDVPLAETFHVLNELFRIGVLDEEPTPPAAAVAPTP
jgi:radical SAM family RiPP maturation amino acid epimerase